MRQTYIDALFALQEEFIDWRVDLFGLFKDEAVKLVKERLQNIQERLDQRKLAPQIFKERIFHIVAHSGNHSQVNVREKIKDSVRHLLVEQMDLIEDKDFLYE